MGEYSEKRSIVVNVCFSIISFMVVVFLADTLDLAFYNIIGNVQVSMLLTYLFCIAILILFYAKDLVREFKSFVKEYDNNISPMLKYYLVGLGCMVFFNLLLNQLIGGISANEEGVREMLFNAPVFSMVLIAIFAPIEEELTFRKSLQPIFKNKWLCCIISGILFGLVHLRIEFVTGTFTLSHLLYILPYGSLGFGFALMNYETKSTFSSIFVHMIHNGLTALLLLAAHMMGVI